MSSEGEVAGHRTKVSMSPGDHQTMATIIDDVWNVSESNNEDSSGKIVSDEVVYWFHVLVSFGISGTISVVGMCFNTINIIVFCRQGALSDSSNITLLGLAFTDLWCLLTIVWTGVCLLLSQEGPSDMGWEPESVMFMSAGWPHVMFSQIACWITAYLAFERCMCVVFPFKVKTMFSARRSLMVLIVLYVSTVLFYVPVFVTHRLMWIDIPGTNTSIFSLKFMKYNVETRDASNYFNTLICRSASILTVLVCTRMTTYKVNSSKNWRKGVAQSGTSSKHNNQSSSAQNQVSTHTPSKNQDGDEVKSSTTTTDKSSQPMSQKESRLVRMITTICIIFLVCYTPDIILVYTRTSVSTLHFMAKHHNLFYTVYLTSFFLESINSSINIFVYYNMSSRYKQEFRRLFRLQS